MYLVLDTLRHRYHKSHHSRCLGRIVFNTDTDMPKFVLMAFFNFKYRLLQFGCNQDGLNIRKWLPTENRRSTQ